MNASLKRYLGYVSYKHRLRLPSDRMAAQDIVANALPDPEVLKEMLAPKTPTGAKA